MTSSHSLGDSRHFSATLLSFSTLTHAEQIRLSAIADYLGGGTIGSLLLFFALPMVLPVPAPGISVVFGVPLMLISAQLLFGRQSLWLPEWLARRTIARGSLEIYVERALPLVRSLEKFVRPRLCGLTGGASLRAVGALCLLLAAIIVLPIPLGHLVPGASISVIGLGLIERDGLAVIAGALIGVVAILIVTLQQLA